MLVELIVILCVSTSSASCAFIAAYLYQLKSLRLDLKSKIEEFDEITKKASEANLSMAEKLISVDNRLDNIDSWRAMMNGSNNSHGWKK